MITLYIEKDDNQRKKQIYEYTILVNILALFVVMAAFIVSGEFFADGLYTPLNVKFIFFLGINLLGFALITVYLSKSKQRNHTEHITRIDVLYMFFFFLGSVLILFLVGDKFYNAEVVLFLPIIVGASIWGKRLGVIFASICTFIFLVYYLTENSPQPLGLVLGKNLIIICIMYIVAWFIGAVADLESNYRRALTTIANTDPLTGLYNHRFFQDELARCYENASVDKPLSLVIIDIDNIKHYNDSFGHIAGDDVLKQVGNILKETVKKRGFVARYGGEEFVIVLPNFRSEEAAQVAEEIRQKINNCKFSGHKYLLEEKLTISSGISSYPHQAKNIKELIYQADQALYRAKSMEKNKVEIYFSIFDNLELGEDEEEILSTIKTLISVINAKDRYAYGHSERVKKESVKLAKRIKVNEQDLKILAQAAALHDIGKIEISRIVLNKAEKLTDEEFAKVKKHVLWGSEIVKEIEALRPVSDIILYHHENYDGTGYPEGLKGEEIPFLSRIIRIVDSYDAMISNRPYQKRISKLEALFEIRRCSGTMFDPILAEEFIMMIKPDI